MNLYKPAPLTARISGRVSEVLVQQETEVSAGEPVVVVIGTAGYVMKAKVSCRDVYRINIGKSVTGRTTSGAVASGILPSRSTEPDYSTESFELTFL